MISRERVMHTLKLKIEDAVFEKVMMFLKSLPGSEIEIVEEKKEGWRHLELEIDRGLESGVSTNSHETIMDKLYDRYV